MTLRSTRLRSRYWPAALLCLAAVSGTAWCAEPRVASGTLVASAVGAGTAIPGLGLAGMLQALLGLALVLVLVLGVAWLVRRFGLQAPRLGNTVKVVGGVMLTPKERVVVVEVQGTWLVLGVAPGQVSMLHSLPATPDAAERGSPSDTTPFAERLRESLAARFGNKSNPSTKSPTGPRGAR
jgi:flagellar protein FliO/FliZ